MWIASGLRRSTVRPQRVLEWRRGCGRVRRLRDTLQCVRRRGSVAAGLVISPGASKRKRGQA
jgi:hypothetical protein